MSEHICENCKEHPAVAAYELIQHTDTWMNLCDECLEQLVRMLSSSFNPERIEQGVAYMKTLGVAPFDTVGYAQSKEPLPSQHFTDVSQLSEFRRQRDERSGTIGG